MSHRLFQSGSLGDIRLRKEPAELPPLKNSRLPVMPVTPGEWALLPGPAGEKGEFPHRFRNPAAVSAV